MTAEKLKTTGELFASFFRIGLFTFGGGYAMIPLIEREAVDGKHWISHEEILDILAIAESTPGPLAINSATFVGYKVAGVLGATVATLGVVLPSFIIISILSLFIVQVKENRWVDYAFRGVRSGVLVLMLNAIIKLGKACPTTAFTYILMALAFLLTSFLGIDIIVVLLCAAITGIAYSLLQTKRKGGEVK